MAELLEGNHGHQVRPRRAPVGWSGAGGWLILSQPRQVTSPGLSGSPFIGAPPKLAAIHIPCL